jgi:AraC family transcriptional regulator of adaptative response / DNA-3-methyladenine glycosylase II
VKTEDEAFFQAVRARDSRFDGKFFVGVKTTGIYCRPICPAKPKRENIEFFPSRLAAERAGYRPCLRCRPESAPSSPTWIGKSALVARALRLIGEGRLLEKSEDEFANALGVSARHLRRVFEAELGKTPKQVSDDLRLDLARKLLVETRLSMSEVAAGSGFSSLRRFNDAVQTRFRRTPRELRGGKTRLSENGKGITLRLAYRPPLDPRNLFDWHSAHSLEGVESVAESAEGPIYRRVFLERGKLGAFSLAPGKGGNSLDLRVLHPNPEVVFPLIQRVRRMFDLDSDPLVVANAFEHSPFWSRLSREYPGLRVARGWDPFETAIATILGQLVSVERGRSLTAALIRMHGRPVVNPFTGERAFLFPTAKKLSEASLEGIGTTRARINAIREFSARVARGELILDPLTEAKAMETKLLAVPGIGRWTAEYVALRALGDPDAFPATDLVLKRVMEKNPEAPVKDLAPWRAYAAVYLWKQYSERKI